MKLGPRTSGIMAALLLTLFSAAVIHNAARWNCTSDERLHLSSGYSYLVSGDFRMAPEQPPLIKELAAAMLLPLHLDFPVNKAAWEDGDQVGFGDDFTFHNRATVEQQLHAGRIPCVLLSILLGMLVYRWAKELHGEHGGLLSLFFFSTCPNIIAHSALVTTDVAVSLFYCAGLFSLWRFHLKQTRRWLYAAALLAAFASLSKYTGLLLYPIAAIYMIYFCFHRRTRDFLLFFYSAAVFVLAWSIPALVLYRSGAFLPIYIDGLRNLNFNFHDPAQISYCLDETYFGSRWYYYLVALAVKSPAPFLIAAGAGVALLIRKQMRLLWFFLLAPALLFFAVVSARVPDNIGFRYVLAVLPILQIVSGGVVPAMQSSPALRKLFPVWILLLLWQVYGAVAIHPNEISYFNEFAGGPRKGYRFLADSNVDWGQNVEDLRSYSSRQPLLIKPFAIDPALYGIRYASMNENVLATPVPGTYILSAHHLAVGRCVWWLRQMQPETWIGNSMLVYRFDESTKETESRLYEQGIKQWNGRDSFFSNDVAIYFAARKHYAEAIPWFRKTLSLRPDHPTARSDLGFALLDSGNAAGFAEIEADLARYPQKAKVALALADSYLQSGNEARARFWLEQVSRNTVWSLYAVQSAQIADIRLGALDQSQGHHELALSHYGKVFSWPLNSRRNQAAALIGSGSALGMLHRPARAAQCFETALKLEPENATAHFVYGMLLSKDPAARDQALRQLQEALRYESDPTRKLSIEKQIEQLQPGNATNEAP